MNITALIPARGGSKGIPKKNLYPLCGKPLIQYTLEAAVQSACFNQVVVSSDSREILDYSRRFGAQELLRPAEIASDVASSDDVVGHLIYTLNLDNDAVLVLLQPTSPLRTEANIKEAVEQFSSNPKPLISFKYVDSACLKNYVLHGEVLKPVFPLGSHRRQSLPTVLCPNGALYIFTVEQFRKIGGIPREGVQPYIMSEDASVDIDSLEDITRAETLLESEAGNEY